MSKGGNFKFDGAAIEKGLAHFENKTSAAVRAYAETSALKLQNKARQKAPWTNRTGHARQRLKGDVLVVTHGYKIRLAHGVDYGKWLELAHEKKWAIVHPTINQESSKVLQGLQGLLNRMN